MGITERRKRRLCESLLQRAAAVVGFADVGSGGPLKRPWSLLPESHIRKFDFEPTSAEASGLPLCVSNQCGRAEFFVAHDERSSSFHRPVAAFVERFGMQSLYPARTIQVERTTLDTYFQDRYGAIDAIDVNVEGHDFQVLQGGEQLLGTGVIKLLKIEFEVAPVWESQGWLSDIDPFLRARGYVLAGIDIDFARPANARHCFHRGEPLWGKALYVPGPHRWQAMLAACAGDSRLIEQAVAKAIALYLAADIPGHAFDALDFSALERPAASLSALELKARIGAAYRWARVEQGATELTRIFKRAVGLPGGMN